MNESYMKMAATRARPGHQDGKTDWARLRAMSDAEVEAAALADPDAPPLSDAELAEFRPVPLVKRVRVHLDLSQQAFADRYHIPVGTIRDWEQRRSQPDAAAESYLKVILHAPDIAARAFAEG